VGKKVGDWNFNYLGGYVARMLGTWSKGLDVFWLGSQAAWRLGDS
jgi:hypothetical protein